MSKSTKFFLAPPKKRSVVPARSKVTVNRSLLNLESQNPKILSKKAEDEGKINEVFNQNVEIAIALLPTVTFRHFSVFPDASTVRKWISALLDPSLPKLKGNSHLSFLVFQMQNMKIADPFDKDPPANLSDFTKAFTGAKLKAMIDEMENKNMKDLLREGLTPHGLANFRTDFKSPPEFFDDQIVPLNGLISYGGCFSNHFQ